MRNTSDPIKENSNVMNAQGGEKKVMKKILSVALSTAMAFSMFASVAFGDTAVSPQQQFDALKAKGIFNGYPDGTAGLDKDMTRAEFAKVITKLLGLKEITGTLSYTDKNYTAKNWAVPYIEAVTAAGIMEGKNVEKKIFDFNGKVTVSEMATILTRALDLEIPAETNNTAPAWAKGYVQAAINAGLVDADTNFTANASRELLVGAAYAIDEAQSLKVSSYTVTEGGKVVEFKISDGETVKVTLDKALEANKETEVKFTYKEKSFTEKVTYVVEAATKVQSASSVNLKEVDVAFDGKVDKATATDKANYNVDNNSRTVKSVTLLEDGKTARVLLDTAAAGGFTQGTTYKVVVKNVKSSTGTVLPQGEVSFTSADNTLPTVTEVKALGTKAIKVTFSEPVKAPGSSNFQLDDKAYVGSVTLGANEREVILRDFTGGIAAGTHKLTASLIEDYAGLKSLASTTEFTTVVDTEGPKVTEISATLEKVTVTFDEEIDPTSVTNDSFYWKNGDSKKTGKVTQISSNVYEVVFDQSNRLPGYDSTLFVEVKDYSGNVNATKEHKVTASVDLTQPKVVEATYGTRAAERLTVRFDKAVDANDIKYYSVKKDGDVVPVKNVSPVGNDGKEFNVEFYSKLSGTYNLKVSDVKDRTALANTLVTYEGTFLASDSNAPQLVTDGYSGLDVKAGSDRRVALTFDREVDLSTLNNRANYYVSFLKKDSSAPQTISLPSDVQLNVDNSGKTVILVFPQYIDGTEVTFGTGSVKGLKISGLKSKTGQATDWVETGALTQVDLQATAVNRKDARTLEVVFNKAIASASAGDFTVSGTTVNSVSVSGNKVTLKTSSDVTTSNTVYIVSNNGIQSYAGNKAVADNLLPEGNLAPKVNENGSGFDSNTRLIQENRTVRIPFTTTLAKTSDAGVAGNLSVYRADKTESDLLSAANGEYTATIEENQVVVTFKDTNNTNIPYVVKVNKNATFIHTAGEPTKYAAESSAYRTTIDSTVAAKITATAKQTTVYKPEEAAVAAKGTAAAFTLNATTPGLAGNKTITIHDVAGTTSVVADADSITFDSTTADIAAIKAAVNGKGFGYEVDNATSVLPTVDVELKGGKDKVEEVQGQVTITLDKAIGSLVTTKVTINSLEYDATLDPAKTKITVNTEDGVVAGRSFNITVNDSNNNQVIINNIVIEAN